MNIKIEKYLNFFLVFKIMYTIDYTPYKLRDWIPLDKINWGGLSQNPRAIELLEQNQNKIDWYKLMEILSLENKHLRPVPVFQDISQMYLIINQ